MSGLRDPITGILASADDAHTAHLEAQVQSIRALICATPLAADLTITTGAAYAGLGAGPSSW